MLRSYSAITLRPSLVLWFLVLTLLHILYLPLANLADMKLYALLFLKDLLLKMPMKTVTPGNG